MELDRWKFSAQREIWSNDIALRIGVKQHDGQFSVAKPLVMERIELGAFAEPCMRIPFDHAQELIDELWQAGLRPSQSLGSVGQIDAVKYHLEDMRRLVFESGK